MQLLIPFDHFHVGVGVTAGVGSMFGLLSTRAIYQLLFKSKFQITNS